MYKAMRQVEISYGSGLPSSLILEEGETFDVVTRGFSDYEWDVLVYGGDEFSHPRWKDIMTAIQNEALVEV